MSGATLAAQRDVFVGRHSSVWRALAAHPLLAQRQANRQVLAIGHRELGEFAFERGDRVWLLSYSRRAAQNRAMLAQLQGAGVAELIYVSSSSTIVCTMTRCYAYPRLKQQAELEALALPNARVLTLGQVVAQAPQLPAGASMATLVDELAAFVIQPDWPEQGGRRKRLMRLVQRPFATNIEAGAYRGYGWLMWAVGRWPCLLRPLDALLRALGWRWYGYVFLSNRLWTATIS